MALFDKEYFIGGAESNYIDYTRKKYAQLARDIKDILFLKKQMPVLDYGCATGLLVYELRRKGVGPVYGTDISEWAINYGRENYNLSDTILKHYNKDLLELDYIKYVLMLDVLEHCDNDELCNIFTRLAKHKKTIIVRIPVSARKHGNFYLDISRKDKTHIQCHAKSWWQDFFTMSGFRITNIIKRKQIYNSKGVLACVITNE